MAKDTLLDIVQGILSDADGDNVNSISDTVESDQCARVVRDVFEQIVDDYDLASLNRAIRLDATSSSTPTVMLRPEGFHTIEWIQYDKKTTAGGDQNYQEVTYQDPKSFFERTSARNLSDSNVQALVLDSGHSLLIYNDRAPQRYTYLEDYNDIIFDAFDSNLETNLQQSKSFAYGILKPELALADETEPDLPKHLFTLLKRESRALYFDLYKDGVSREVDRTRRKAEVRSQRLRHMTKDSDNYTGPDYGRKRR